MIVSSMMLSLSAQEVPSKKKGNLEIGIGVNTFGPVPQMATLMVEHGFDIPSENWLFGGPLHEHPSYDRVGLSFQISYSRNLGPRSQLGIMLHYSRLRNVWGYTYIDEYLNVLFSSVYVVTLYTFELNQYWDFQVGPGLMINSANPKYAEDAKKDTKLSPGLLIGLNLKIWDKTLTYGKISTHYLLTTRNNIGPYTVEAWSGGATVTIPESKIGFGHLNIVFTLGFHI
jgi:hypothetical protein